MIICYEIELTAKNKDIAIFLNEMYEIDCEISEMNLLNSNENSVDYFIKILVKNDYNFRKKIKTFASQKEKFQNLKCRNVLEKRIKNGVLSVDSDIDIETSDSYKINLLGLLEVLKSKISKSDNPEVISGLVGNTAVVSSINKKNSKNVDKYVTYASQEIDSIILKKFTGYNSFPFFIEYFLKEDFIKNLLSLRESFSAFRLFETDDENDPEYYTYIIESIQKPLLSRRYDEKPIFVLALIMHMVHNHKLNIEDINVGFIGLDMSAVRLASVLLKSGFMRVLGYDSEDKTMMYFEKKGGLATTRKNIFGNSDIIIIMKNDFQQENYAALRPGVIIGSFIKDAPLEKGLKEQKGCRRFYKGETDDYGSVFPALISYMIEDSVFSISDEMMIEISKILSKHNYKEDKSKKNIIKIHQDIISGLRKINNVEE